MNIEPLFATFWRRLLVATLLWIVFWPLLWLIKIGDITGPKAFFWIVWALNYPAALLVFMLLDSLLVKTAMRLWMVFVGSAAVAALTVPFYHQRVGFRLGVPLEAFLF